MKKKVLTIMITLGMVFAMLPMTTSKASAFGAPPLFSLNGMEYLTDVSQEYGDGSLTYDASTLSATYTDIDAQEGTMCNNAYYIGVIYIDPSITITLYFKGHNILTLGNHSQILFAISGSFDVTKNTCKVIAGTEYDGSNAVEMTWADVQTNLASIKYMETFPEIEYPEVWEPYYETLALKIQAQAEIEAKKMLEEAKAFVEPVEEKPIELVAKTSRMIAPDGKDSVKVTWVEKYGRDLDFEGYDIYRATTIDGTYRFMFNTTNEWYYNTLIRRGNHYWYMVRGYNNVLGEKVYSQFSNVVDSVVE